MAFISGWPAPLRWLFWIAVAVIIIFILSLIISPLGGFDWHVKIGHLFWDLGVTGH